LPSTICITPPKRSTHTRSSVASEPAESSPSHVRFQFGFPASSSAIEEYFSEPGDLEIVKRAYESALRCEIERLLEVIPASDLAIQFDFSNEVVDLAMGDVSAK